MANTYDPALVDELIEAVKTIMDYRSPVDKFDESMIRLLNAYLAVRPTCGQPQPREDS